MKNNEIKILLNRWYAALCTSEEEDRLETLLRDHIQELPPELKEEAKTFLLLRENRNVQFDVPNEISSRINCVMEGEMSRYRYAYPFRKFVMSAVAIVASLIIIGTITFRLMRQNKEKIPDIVQTILLADTVMAKAPIKSEQIAESSNRINVSSNEGKKLTKKTVACMKSCVDSTTSEEVQPDDSYSIPQGNYRIITDPDEADELLSVIFSRLNNRIALETARLEMLELDYNAEMAGISDITNYTYTEYEQTPL